MTRILHVSSRLGEVWISLDHEGKDYLTDGVTAAALIRHILNEHFEDYMKEFNKMPKHKRDKFIKNYILKEFNRGFNEFNRGFND